MTINIPFEFEVTCEAPKNTKPFFTNECYSAWSEVILKAVKARLNACRISLFENRDRVYFINENMLAYTTETSNRSKHYSILAANAMESVISKLESSNYDFETAELVQIDKALHWVDKERYTLRQRYSFDDLISIVVGNI